MNVFVNACAVVLLINPVAPPVSAAEIFPGL